METLFTILLMFLQCTDHAATSATSRILCFLVATFLQSVLHIGWGHRFTSWTITCHRSLILHTLQHPLLVFKNCALSALLHIFTISIISYIRSSSQICRTSDQSPNWLISTSSCVPAAEHYCHHPVHGSPKNINPGTSNMETKWSNLIFNSPSYIGYIVEE